MGMRTSVSPVADANAEAVISIDVDGMITRKREPAEAPQDAAVAAEQLYTGDWTVLTTVGASEGRKEGADGEIVDCREGFWALSVDI